MILAGVAPDLSALPAGLLPALVDALPRVRARRLLELIQATTFPHLEKVADRRQILLELRAAADPGFIRRLRPPKRKDKNDG